MGFWRELKDGIKMQADVISFGLGKENSIGYNAFLRNENVVGNDDYSLP